MAREGYSRIIKKGETKQAGFEPTREDCMICSRKFAEWLLKISRDEGHAGEPWMNIILRYCNAAYPELIREELRKANDFYYYFTYDTAAGWISIHPSYEVVSLCALDPADEKHIRTAVHPVRGYSILTTGASFPGKQQDQYENSFPWNLSRLTWDCINFLYNCFPKKGLTEEENRKVHGRNLTQNFEPYTALVRDDVYSYREFQLAQEDEFIDNEPPFSYGPSCPDRLLWTGSYAHTRRALTIGAAGICKQLKIEKEYPEFFWLSIVCQMIGSAGGIVVGKQYPLSSVMKMAEQAYAENLSWLLTDQEKNRKRLDACAMDLEFDYCEMIYMSLCSEVNFKIEENMDDETRKMLDSMKEDALKNKAYAFAPYRSPQEIYSV